MHSATAIITLSEYEPILLSTTDFAFAAAQRLWCDYPYVVEVEPPSFKTGNNWRLTNLGWVGYLPLTSDCALALQPKTPLANLLRMVEEVYELAAWQLLDGRFRATTLPEFYERLACLLAQRVLHRCRRGLHRAYRPQRAPLPYVRGQLDLTEIVRRPPMPATPCHYHEHTADIEDNQILLWTLHQILRSGLCTAHATPTIHQAARTLQTVVTLQPQLAQACRRRAYTRLNQDYQPLHALCALFLEQSGPSHLPGEVEAIPFMVEMASLYERYVAAWLQRHLDAQWRVQVQERHPLGGSNQHFAIDLVLYSATTGAVHAVLDTKYKIPITPATADIAQVVAYAEAKGAREAILIYPQPLAEPLDVCIGQIRVRTLTFNLADELATAGQAFLQGLLPPD
ncbi:MAG: hypothetical protein R3C14_17760 [Caldilineaceae bacterium]